MLATMEREQRPRPEQLRMAELRNRLGSELESLERELAGFLALDPAAAAGGTGFRPVSSPEREVQRRLRLYGQLMAGLAAVAADALPDDRAGYGSVVFVRDLDSGREGFHTIVTGDLIDLDANQVSMESPMGQALLGRRPGDEVVVETPHRRVRLRVLTVDTLPRRLGMAPRGG